MELNTSLNGWRLEARVLMNSRIGLKHATMGAVEEINETAKDMEALYDASTVAKTHLGLKEP